MKAQRKFFCNFFRNICGQSTHWLVVGLGFLLTSCADKKPPSAILILVDQFKVSDLRCSQEQVSDNIGDKRGFEILCEDFVRFTHAYTPSTLELPAIASILTGTYPFEHNLRDNSQFLSRKTVTFAEQLSAKGYKDFFISAGLPVLRKSGLQQGFDVFDDAISTQLSHRSAEDVLRKSLLYLRDLPASKPFLFVMHLQDLGYPYSQRNSEPLSYEERSMFGVMDNLSDALGRYFSELKRIQKWNDSLIIVAGLRGRSDIERAQKISALNLHSENTQVALFIKPPTKPQDELQNWKVDHSVTLADLGPTVKDYLELPQDPAPSTTISLKSALQNLPNAEELSKRTIVLESGYSTWRLSEKPYFAFINNNYLYIHNTERQLYNLRVDSFEINPTASISPKNNSDFREAWVHQAINQTQATLFNESSVRKLFPESLYTDTLLWRSADNDREIIQRLTKFYRNKSESAEFPRYKQWLLYLLLSQRKWQEIVDFSNNDYLTYVALVNLDSSQQAEDKKKQNKTYRTELESLVKTNPCLQQVHDIYQKKSTVEGNALDRCTDEKLKMTIQYLFSDVQNSNHELMRKRLESRLKSHMILRRFLLLNESKQLEFDLDTDLMHLIEPFEAMLYLPVVNRLRIELLNNLITRENRTDD